MQKSNSTTSRRLLLGKGRFMRKGYIVRYCPTHPLADSSGCVKDHRLVYEEHNNCCLLPKTVIHHIDGVKTNNHITNLQPFTTNAEHISFELRKDMSNRFCSNCGTTKTTMKSKERKWYNWGNDGNGGYLCNKCIVRRNSEKYRKNRELRKYNLNAVKPLD